MKVALLAGGTGGTKLAHGFAQLPEVDLSVVANVADDVELHGLHVSPDIDALLYTLAGLIDAERGWGLRGDTLTAQAMLERLGQPTWFTLGDGDLATHVTRTRMLRDGETLTDATAAMAAALGIGARILPATDDRLRTMLTTDGGEIDFQEYFVHRRQQPEVRAIRLDGIETARPTAAAVAAMSEADVVVIGPSNPIVSIGPILALPGIREAVGRARAVAVSPIVGGVALKGPADRMLASLGHEPTALGVARIYGDLVGTWVIDEVDAALAPAIREIGARVEIRATVMREDQDRRRLAMEILALMLD
jgi:LPPG:FO 2-phospho-L-lactate transferase